MFNMEKTLCVIIAVILYISITPSTKLLGCTDEDDEYACSIRKARVI